MKFFGKKQAQNNLHTVGLALSGGGTRGFAHIGVFKALEEAGIKISCVAGTSAGSIMGALYCAKIPWQKMVEQSKLITAKDVINKRFWVGSDSDNIAVIVKRLLGDTPIEKLPIPFTAVAVDLSSGVEVELNKGDVATAVSASSAVPALFTPVKIDGMVLVDGGLLNNMPADVCRRMGADIVIGVDLNHTRGQGTTSGKLWDTLLASWNITTKSTMYKGQMNSDVIITPELAAYKNTKLQNIDEMVDEGYRAAKEKIPAILDLINSKF